MFCEKCGMQLQDGEKFCPICGTPAPADSASSGGTQQGGGLQPAAGAPGGVAAPAGAVLAVNGAAPSQPVSGGKKKSKKKLFIAIGAVAVAAVLGVVTFACELPSKIGNFVHKTFSSSEDYYQYVEKENSQDMANSAAGLYQAFVLDSKNIFETTSNSTVTLTFGEGFKDIFKLAESVTGMDFSWLQSISSTSSVTINGNQFGFDLSTSLNKDKLLSLVMALNLDEGALFLQLPELTSTYMGIDLEEAMGVSFKEVVDAWEDYKEEYIDFIEALPSRDRVEKLISKYIGVVTSCVDDVDKKTVTLKVEGVSQKCTALEITVDADLIVDMLGAILDEAESDSELEDLIVDIVEALGEDGDDVYEEMLDELETLYDELEGSRGDGEMILTLYVDSNGTVIGRKLEAEGGEFAMLMTESGGKFGYELSMYIDNGWSEKSVSLLGSGKKSGDKIDGEFVLSYYDGYDDVDILELTTEGLDTKALKEGQLNGKIVVDLTYDAGKMIIGSSYGASIIEDLKFTISGSSSKSSAECTIGVVYGKKDMISITVATEQKKASDVKIPKSKDVIFIEDDRDLEDWVDTIDWKKFYSGLEKTDLPAVILDPLEEICDALENGDFEALEEMFNDLYYELRRSYRYLY